LDLEVKKKEKTINKRKNKGNKGLGKNCIHDRYSSPPSKAPTNNIHPWFSLCLGILRPHHLILHGLDDILWELSFSYG
jgi:hypothetical protein